MTMLISSDALNPQGGHAYDEKAIPDAADESTRMDVINGAPPFLDHYYHDRRHSLWQPHQISQAMQRSH